MDPFLLTVWLIRLLFLGLLYLFLFRVARALLGDLRAAAREPGAELGRLVVVTSPGGEPEEGTSGAPSRRRITYSINSESLSSWIENQSHPCWLARRALLPNS